ncbi:M23 family metallopeptidase [Streptomyces sp. RFCAC02]|uniref:M23 family metallopeptidase n=1 Tax=Streptomyces sp. RFCAC02 TaxID=2499143 RepID=UPI00101F65D9|nr:M23 family metallopeptidase [Streptomyces sp. RFCAC02]
MRTVIASFLSVLTCLLLSAGAAASPDAPADAGAGAGVRLGGWPLAGAPGARRPVVERLHEPPPEPWAAGHRGVDLAGAAGDPVRAAGPGRVTFAGQVAGRGVVTVELEDSGTPPVRLTHEPVLPAVAVGDDVVTGTVLGALAEGPSHCAGRPCLHWGALRDDTYLDPLSLLPRELLRDGPSRLLPVTGVPVPDARVPL